MSAATVLGGSFMINHAFAAQFYFGYYYFFGNKK